ncbi:hypothetical protein ES703_76324 [subsurface metagenome]
MAAIDKYANTSLEMAMLALEGLSTEELTLVLRFAEFLKSQHTQGD